MNPFLWHSEAEPSSCKAWNGSSCLVLKMKIFCSIYEPETHPSPLKSIKSDEITSDGNPCKPNGKHIELYMIQEYRSFTIFFVVVGGDIHTTSSASTYITWLDFGGKERLTRNWVLHCHRHGNSIVVVVVAARLLRWAEKKQARHSY